MSFERVCSVAEQYQANSNAPLGFAFKDLQTGESICFHGDEPFPTASAFKVYVLAALYQKIQNGELSRTDCIPLAEEQKAVGSGVLSLLDAGLNLTVKDYAMLMMTISDNTATDVLYALTGREYIQEHVIRPLGLTQTKCDYNTHDLIDTYYEMNGRTIEEMLADYGGVPSYRNSPCYACQTEKNDQTSPLDAQKLYEALYRGEWITPEVSREMIGILKECQTNSRIPHFLPPFTTVAHKTGTLDRLAVDTGIVYTPKGDYFLALFYNGNLASEADYDADPSGLVGDRYLAECSRDIYHAFMQ